MGVDIKSLIKEYAPDAISRLSYSDCYGQTWAVDASIFCYKFCYDGYTSKNKKPPPNPHIRGFYQMIKTFLSFGIKLIIVFDGSTPPQKQGTVDKRKADRAHKKAQLELMRSTGAPEADIKKLESQIISFPDTTYTDIIHLCQLFNVPTLRANFEADALCIKLQQLGIVQGIVSNDCDILMFGGQRFLHNYDYSNEIDCIDFNKLLASMKLTHDEFISMCILCGTDYTDNTLTGIGKSRAYKLVQSLSSSFNVNVNGNSNIIDIIEQKQQTDFTVFMYQSAFDYVKTAPDNENLDDINLKLSYETIAIDIKWDEINTLMMSKCNCMKSTIPKHKLEVIAGLSPRTKEITCDSSNTFIVPKFHIKLKFPLITTSK